MDILSRIVFDADTDEGADELEAKLMPHIRATRCDYLERRTSHKVVDDVTGEAEAMVYVIVNTGNIRGMVIDLLEAGIM